VIEPKFFLGVVFAIACARDQTITRGADGANDWKRRVEVAIPLGISVDSAKSVFARNAFNCGRFDSRDSTLRCEKDSGGRFEFVRRRWIAVLQIESGRVTRVESATGLIGP